MGILDDFLGFGTTMNSGTTELKRFYRSVYFHFNLPSPVHLKEGTKVPVRVASSGWVNKEITSFEIHGQPNSHFAFTSNRWENVFNRINRDFPAGRGLAWCFDTSRLTQGILSGRVVTENGPDHLASQEHLTTLYLLGETVGTYSQLSKIPHVQLGFGPLWERYGVPDQIFYAVESIYPFKDNDFLRANQVIIHRYTKSGAPLTYAYSGNPATGTMTITPRETEAQPEAPTQYAPQANVPPQPQNPPSPQVKDYDLNTAEGMMKFVDDLNRIVEPNAAEAPSAPAPTVPEDGFPYEFFRGLGLIDHEDMVEVPTILGKARVHMTQDVAKAALLEYKPES